jgi:hypothetical protein
MKNKFRLVTTFVTALVLISPVIAQAGPQSHPLNEDTALALLVRTLKHDGVYKNRISLDCVTFITEETTGTYFEFALREKHDAKCAGDPEVSPIVDRYRVYRRGGKIEQYKPIDDTWQRYKSPKTS